ncbi:MAG: FlgD immunoglobulin-like domain containing protein [Candidatus Cloacimonetes bacterium]|nr:FlgD immunoglobulin-like domain containing protein [Candidatus Cloacimonadota bacterium]
MITVSKHDFKPLQQSIVVENVGTLVPGAIVIDDDNGGSSSGNTNGTINNGETIELLFGLRNTASTSINGVTGYVTTLSPYVTFLDSLVTYPDISAGEVGYNVSPAVMQVSPDTPNGTTLRLHLYLTDGASATYHVSEFIYVESPELVFTTATIVDTDNQALDPGETIDYFVTSTNQGTMGASALQARLYTLNDLISVTDNYGLFGDITPGGQATSAADNFVLYAREQVLPGMVIPLQLKIFNNEGFEQYVDFSITIGVVTSTDPLGPCAYGYVIYDDTDTSYPLAPVYDWVEIAPSLGGQGTAITISDVYNSSNEGDQVGATSIATVNLPFPFQFYGRIYEQVSVCSNGFLALGVSENGEFRNYRIPGAMGPSPMIAAFWDDMATHTASGIYYWFDRNNHAFVVQWQNMKNGYNGSSEETFQIILYDQSVYSTSLGDGPIKIQYKVFNNVNAQSGNRHGNYCTIGIEDHTGTRGLEYSYNNHYPTAAAQLGNQRAIYITNIPVYYEAAQLIIGDTYVNDDNGNGVVEPGEEINLGIQLSNIGNVVADQINTTLSTDSEYVNITVSESAYFPVEAETSGVNRIPFTFVVSPNCPNGTLINFSLNITAGEYEWTRTFAIRVDASVLSYHSFLVNDYDSNFNGIIDPNETVKLVINISNNSDVEAREVVGTLLTENPFIIVAEPVKTIPIIPSNTTTQLVYGVTFDAGLTAGTLVNFSFSASCINGLPFSKDIFVPFNQADIQNDFELDNGNLMSETGWAWGTPNQVTPPSGNKLWATGLSGQYPHFVLYQLYTPVYSIVGPSQLTFQHRYGTEQSYDGGNVSISTDGGENFTILNPVGGYPNTSISGLFGEPGYSGNSSNFVTATFDLSAYQGQDVIIRFRFGSNDDIGNIGWFIDDFDVTGVSKKVGFVHGTVLPTSGMDPSLAMVKSSIGLATSPASDGLYRLYLPNGHYTATASLKHHTSSTNNQVNITQDNPLRVADFTLIDLPKPLSVGYTVNNDTGVLNIMWTEPYEPVLPVLGYKVYRKFNAGNFVMVQETTSTTYSEVLELEGRYIFYVVAKYINTDGMPSDIMSFPFPYVPGEDDVVPGLVTRLGNNYPNPFNPTTNIAFDLAQSGDVHIRIYNLKGQLVKDLVKGHQKAGRHNIIWNGKDNSNRNVSSGVYFYRMETNSYTKTMKMLLMK